MTNPAENQPELLEELVKKIRSIPRLAAASTVYGLSLLPFFAGGYNLFIDGFDHIIGLRTPSLMEYGADIGLATLGTYIAVRLQKPAIRAAIRIIYPYISEESRRDWSAELVHKESQINH